ncbi:MAG TPA: ATP synthase F0 subunit B [Nitrospirota bacterium]|nr:ATP synthase F0 subunit B [Nitrospirota bacterium]
MKILDTIRGAVNGLACVMMSAAIAVAEEAEHGGHEEAITFMGDWLPRLVNFAIIAGVVVYFARKPIRDFFANRTNEIAKAMQESKEARERAVAALADMEHKIKDMKAETDRMIAEAQARGEKDRQALVEEGKKIAQDVLGQVKEGIDIEVEKAKTTLAAEAALLSLDLAEGSIKSKIGAQDHERIVKEYIAKVGGRG